QSVDAASDLDANDLDASDLDASDVDASDVDASVSSCPATLETSSFATTGATVMTARAVWTGAHHLVVYTDGDLWAQRLDVTGAPLSAAVSIPGTAGARAPNLVRLG